MEILQNITIENKQMLCQAQIQSLEILAMDTVELGEFLQNEYMSNPLLEHHSNQEMNTSMEKFSEWYDHSYKGMDYSRDRDDDFEERRTIPAPDTDYLKNYLTSQLDIQRFSKKDWNLVLYLIDCLGDDGFFRMEAKEVADLTGWKEERVEEVLEELRMLEPFGIFAKDLPHCLLRQLEVMGVENSDLEEMILHYLPEISEGKISVISRNMGLSTAQVRKYIAVISKLNPKPLSGLRESEVSYIVPDIIYEKRNGQWEVKVNDNWFGDYQINDYYLKMMKDTKDPELFEYFKKKLERSRFILTSIEQRRSTMRAISEIVLEKQRGYLEGKEKLKPMTMCGLAQELDIHPSTVSRAIKGKYIQSPAGTILMKKLFCATVSSGCDGEEVSASHIKERIRQMVEEEDKTKPLSDAKLAELLVEEGIRISRRAVAKYRDELWIKSSFDRKIRQ